MLMWQMIMMATLLLLVLSLAYLAKRVCCFDKVQKFTQGNVKKQMWFGGIVVFGVFILLSVLLNLINAMVCAVYFAMFWLILDGIYLFIKKFYHKSLRYGYFGLTAIFLSIISLSIGWYLDHHVWQTNYVLLPEKNVPEIKIVMFADSHIGTTFDAEGFAKHLKGIQAQNPDMVIIAGDYVDDDTSRDEMIKATATLGQLKTKYGIYFAFGNHDKGYYGAAHRGFSSDDLVAELTKNDVKVLRDETVLIDDKIYVIGRRDYSVEKEQGGYRLSMQEIVDDLDKNKYMIVIDHQPADYANQTNAKVDLVLSGHTHGGQLFPFNYVGKWIGDNNKIYGYERRDKTDFIVTSGISDWAIKFKTGTKSEYVVIDLKRYR